MIYKVTGKESIYDICLKFYRTLDDLDILLMDNDLDIFESLIGEEIFIRDERINQLPFDPKTGLTTEEILTKYNINEITDYTVNDEFYMYTDNCKNNGTLTSTPYQSFLLIVKTNTDASFPRGFEIENLSIQDFNITEYNINNSSQAQKIGLYLNALGLSYDYRYKYYNVSKIRDDFEGTFTYRIKANDGYSNYSETHNVTVTSIFGIEEDEIKTNNSITNSDLPSVYLQNDIYVIPNSSIYLTPRFRRMTIEVSNLSTGVTITSVPYNYNSYITSNGQHFIDNGPSYDQLGIQQNIRFDTDDNVNIDFYDTFEDELLSTEEIGGTYSLSSNPLSISNFRIVEVDATSMQTATGGTTSVDFDFGLGNYTIVSGETRLFSTSVVGRNIEFTDSNQISNLESKSLKVKIYSTKSELVYSYTKVSTNVAPVEFDSYELPPLSSVSIPNNLEINKHAWRGEYGLFRNFSNQMMNIVHKNGNSLDFEIDHFPSFNLKRENNSGQNVITLKANEIETFQGKKYNWPELNNRFKMNRDEFEVINIGQITPTFHTLIVEAQGINENEYIDFIWDNALYRSTNDGTGAAFSQTNPRINENFTTFANSTLKFFSDDTRFKIYDLQPSELIKQYDITVGQTSLEFDDNVHIIEINTQGQPSNFEYSLKAGGFNSGPISQAPNTVKKYIFYQNNSISIKTLSANISINSYTIQQIVMYDSGADYRLPRNQAEDFKTPNPNIDFHVRENVNLDVSEYNNIIYRIDSVNNAEFKIDDGSSVTTYNTTTNRIIENTTQGKSMDLIVSSNENDLLEVYTYTTNLNGEQILPVTNISNTIGLSQPLNPGQPYLFAFRNFDGNINIMPDNGAGNFTVQVTNDGQWWYYTYVPQAPVTLLETDMTNGEMKIEGIVIEENNTPLLSFQSKVKNNWELDRYFKQGNYNIEFESDVTGIDIYLKVNDNHTVSHTLGLTNSVSISNKEIRKLEIISNDNNDFNIENIRISQDNQYIYELVEDYTYTFSTNELYGKYNDNDWIVTSILLNRITNKFQIFTNTENHVRNCTEDYITLPPNVDFNSTTKEITIRGEENAILNSLYVFASGSEYDDVDVSTFVNKKLK